MVGLGKNRRGAGGSGRLKMCPVLVLSRWLIFCERFTKCSALNLGFEVPPCALATIVTKLGVHLHA